MYLLQVGSNYTCTCIDTHVHTCTHALLTYTCAVPSGHILTKEELQVLGTMLAIYSDEKLKSIQLSLQEEQEIRDISREEVEKSLRQSGLGSMADGLKDNIEKGIVWFLTAYTCTSTGLQLDAITIDQFAIEDVQPYYRNLVAICQDGHDMLQ